LLLGFLANDVFAKNRNFGQKSKFWSKVQILVQNPKFRPKSKFWTKIQILLEQLNVAYFKDIP